jgi:hypothetical protein
MLEEILESPAFYILTGIGYVAFVFMLVILKGMGNSSIMPFWVKIVTIIAIPVAAALFTGVAEG